MGVEFSVSFSDPGQKYLDYYDDVSATILAAGEIWADYIDSEALLEVNVNFDDPKATADTASATSVFLGTIGGIDLFQQGAAAELSTGIDPNGAAPDILISINASYLEHELWFDPTPFDRSDPVPADKTDAVSTWLHEIGHALGFLGWRNVSTGVLPGNFMSTFDQYVLQSQGNFYFTGVNAVSAYGENVPLTSNNLFHYGNQSGPGTDLVDDGLMNGVTFHRGNHYTISSLDLAILDDTGVPIVDVFGSPGDDLLVGSNDPQSMRSYAGSDLVVGHDGGDRIKTGPGSDYADAGSGNDVLLGEAGRDWLRGGDGDDLIVGDEDYDFVIEFDGDADFADGGNGNDTLWGDAAADVLIGAAGNDTLYGGDGADWLSGDDFVGHASGADTLYGDNGADIIFGGNGNDLMVGGADADTVFGGTGADTLVVASADGATLDVFIDFVGGIDRIDLVGLSVIAGLGNSLVTLNNGAQISAVDGYLWQASDFI
jgi:Ca2+-binding RTX toxin-like protein